MSKDFVIPQKAKADTSRPRSKSMHTSTKQRQSLQTEQPTHTRSVHTSEHHTKSSLPYQNLPQSVSVTEKEVDIQHADYVNESRIQAMLAESKRNQPRSAPTVVDQNLLPLPGPHHHHEGQREFGMGGGGEQRVGW